MPYIKEETRNQLDRYIDELTYCIYKNSDENSIEGILNYTITRISNTIIACTHEGPYKWRYKFINRIIGVLECIKLEFYRRLAGPYEDKAKKENGDIEEYVGVS